MKGGMLVIVLSPNGDVVGSSACFDQEKQSGFSVEDTQERKARREAWHNALRGYCPSAVSAAIMESYIVFESVTNNLVKNGWRVQCLPVGDRSEP